MTKTTDRLRVTQFVRGPRPQVFRAFSDPALARKWGPDGCRVIAFEADMRVGGTFREVMSCGGERHTAHGVYRAIVPEERVVLTHQWEEEHPVETVVAFEFKDRPGGTEIVLTQTGFRDAAAAKGHEEGWSSALARFAKLVVPGARAVPRSGARSSRPRASATPAREGRALPSARPAGRRR